MAAKYPHIKNLPPSIYTIEPDISLPTGKKTSEDFKLKQAVKSIKNEIFGNDKPSEPILGRGIEVYCNGKLLFDPEDIIEVLHTEELHYRSTLSPLVYTPRSASIEILLIPTTIPKSPLMDIIQPPLTASKFEFVINHFNNIGYLSKKLILHGSVVTEYGSYEDKMTLTIVPDMWTVDINQYE